MGNGKPGRPRKRPAFGELPEILQVPQVAEYLDVAPSTIYEAVRRGEFPALRLGQRVLISRWQLAAALGIAEGGDSPALVSKAQDMERPA